MKQRYFLSLFLPFLLIGLFTTSAIIFSLKLSKGEFSVLFLIFSIVLIAGCYAVCYFSVYRFIFIDSFTLCHNHIYVMRKLGKQFFLGKGEQYAAFYINIKDFKYINQRYGMEIGDISIIQTSKRLQAYAAKHNGYAGRLGGDNFFVVISKKELVNFIEYLKNFYINVELENEEVKIHIKFRCGILSFDKDTKLINIIFHTSIAASMGKEQFNDFTEFKPYMLENFVRSKKIVSDARKGLQNNEFVPFYQPKIDPATGRICGAEALVRWRKDDQLIAPGEFVSALEKSGAIEEVDFRVFELVCQDIYNWLTVGIEPVRISTNFSKLHMKNPDFVRQIIEIKDRYKIDGKYLEVELTESAGISDFAIIQKFAEQIKDANMHVSIDDFGTGYSSLSMLQKINADVVKMDKSFLDHSFKDGSKQFIVDIINIVKHQNQKVLFEGVELKEQVEFLKNNGCDIIQGFYYDRPLPHDEFEKRLLNPEYN